MGRGKRQQSRGGFSLSEGAGRPLQVLPASLVESLKPAPVPKPPAPRATKPLVVDLGGTVSAEGLAVLTALQAQMDWQVSTNDWNSSRVPNGMLQPPEGMSDSKYKKILTPLRKAGLVKTKNGMWWVLPDGREVLAAAVESS